LKKIKKATKWDLAELAAKPRQSANRGDLGLIIVQKRGKGGRYKLSPFMGKRLIIFNKRGFYRA
jgi:hypothetical protein